MTVQTESAVVLAIRVRVAVMSLLVALVLAACGSNAPGEAAATPSHADGATGESVSSSALEGITLSGGTGDTPPAVSLPRTPFTLPGPASRVVSEGSGKAIEADDTVLADYLLINGRDGQQRASMWGASKVRLSMSRIPQFAPLTGTKLGSTVLLAIPAAQAVGSTGDATLDISAEDTLVYVLRPTSASAPLSEATGKTVAPRAGLPTVTMGAKVTDPATFTVPKATPPASTITQPLIIGSGPTVTPGQTVRVRYTGVTWRNPAEPFDYSGKSPKGYAEFQVGTGNLIKAWDDGIVGQAVGSRLLLVVAPKDGYGDSGSGSAIQPGDTLIFVIDILDAS